MRMNSIDISGKIDPAILDPIDLINRVAIENSIPFFLVGAKAREFLLEYWHEIRPSRATLDIDFGIQVPGWNKFEELKKGLVSTGDFQAAREIDRLYYLKNRIYIDLIPFGPIEGHGREISWPPNKDIVMNVLGFEDSFNNSQTVLLRQEPRLEIRIVTLPGLAMMKLLSWNDGYPNRARDASDLKIIMYSYTDAGNVERIFDELIEFNNSDLCDYVAAGSILLGQDMSKIMSDETRKIVVEILERETAELGNYRLIEDMIRSGSLSVDDFEYAIKLLRYIKQGINNI